MYLPMFLVITIMKFIIIDNVNRYGIVEFNVPLDTLYVISATVLRVSHDPTNSVIALKDDG